MGMFDTFVTKNEFKCLSCNNTVTMKRGIQSKQFESELISFRPGDVPREMNEDKMVVEDYDWCPDCGETIPVFFSFHRGIYVEAFDSYDVAVLASKSFDVISAYKSLSSERTKLADNFYSMTNDLISVHELHSKHPSKQRMSPFMMLRQTDILDFNIITTLQNIINKYKDD